MNSTVVIDRRSAYRRKRDALIQALPAAERSPARFDLMRRKAIGSSVKHVIEHHGLMSRFRKVLNVARIDDYRRTHA